MDKNLPKLEKVDDQWVLTAMCAAPVWFPLEDRGLANRVFQVALESYKNGRNDRLTEIREALGL